MLLTDLGQSGFRKLNLIEPDCDAPTADGTGTENGNRNSDLAILFESLLDKIPKSIEPSKIDICKLLSKPSFDLPIGHFIKKQERKCSDSKKNAAKSAEYITLGNEEYELEHYSSAVYYNTMAIIYAPDVPEKIGNDVDDKVDDDNVSEELSLAYGNRSAAFYELGQYEAALADIDHSLATGYPREKQPKLLLRKVECLISLKQLGEAKRVWEHFCRISGSELKDDDKEVIPFQLLDIDSNDADSPQHKLSSTDPFLSVLNYLTRTGRYEPSPDYASMSSKVEPKYLKAKSKGRHLVAKHDIEPGDILMVESPFAIVLGKHFEYHFCHHCCRQLESKIDESKDEFFCITGSVVPCTECTRVLYCSTSCRIEAWRTYHQFECSILAVLHQMPARNHLALRMLLTTGLDVAQQVIDQNSQDTEPKDPLNSLKITDPDDCAAKYELVHKLTDLQDEHLSECVILSVVLLQLTKKCAFVRTAEQEKLASSILLCQLLQLYANPCMITGYEFSKPDKAHDFANGLYPHFSSLMNHSCEPNSEYTYVKSTVLILRATKKISAGSEVTINYHKNGFIEAEWSERRRDLRKSLFFWCECSRCELEARDGLNGKYFPIGCELCGSTLTCATSISETSHCPNLSCSAASMSLVEVQKLYSRIESRFTLAENRILSYMKNPNPQQNVDLLMCELDIEELSNIRGLRNCWQLGKLHRRLSGVFGRSCVPEFRWHFARYCEISEANNGLVNAVRNYRNLIVLYRKCNTYRDDERNVIEEYRRIGQRLIEIVRLALITDVEPPTDGSPDLFVNESRDLRKLYREVVDILNRFPKE